MTWRLLFFGKYYRALRRMGVFFGCGYGQGRWCFLGVADSFAQGFAVLTIRQETGNFKPTISSADSFLASKQTCWEGMVCLGRICKLGVAWYLTEYYAPRRLD
jgi:hypothetical protein